MEIPLEYSPDLYKWDAVGEVLVGIISCVQNQYNSTHNAHIQQTMPHDNTYRLQANFGFL